MEMILEQTLRIFLVLKGDNLKINTIHQKLTVAPRPVLQLKTKQQMDRIITFVDVNYYDKESC
jgi:hypothetical protein